MAYFDTLNYTLANEDARIEHDLLPLKESAVFTVAGSGARVLPLVARHPARLVVNDLVREQLFLCELRLAAARALSYPEFLFFLGYRGGLPVGRPEGDDRSELFRRLKLSADCRAFWVSHESAWKPRGFIFLGKWESHFIKISKLFQRTLRLNVRAVFGAHSLDAQIAAYNEHWKPRLFRNFLRLVANDFVFNRFLYKGHFAGAKDRRTDRRPPWKFLDDEFHRLFTTTLVRKSYFLQMLFLGEIAHEEGLPFEAHLDTVNAVRKSPTEVVYRQGDLLEMMSQERADFYSLSDVISYLPDEMASAILQKIPATVASNTRVVIRSFLRAPAGIRHEGWALEQDESDLAFKTDCTGVYRFHIFRKI